MADWNPAWVNGRIKVLHSRNLKLMSSTLLPIIDQFASLIEYKSHVQCFLVKSFYKQLTCTAWTIVRDTFIIVFCLSAECQTKFSSFFQRNNYPERQKLGLEKYDISPNGSGNTIQV